MFGRKTSLAWRRRRLLALGGVGAALASRAITETPRVAQATGPVVGMNNYGGSPDAGADGVQGYAIGANNAGTFGRNNDLNGVGVYGASPNGTGLYGESTKGTAVGARSTSSYAVYAESTNGTGVYSKISSGHAAVYGNATTGGGQGIFGQAANNAGVYGQSVSGNIGVYGESADGTGLVGRGLNSGSRAGWFLGNVDISGNLTVSGSFTVTGSPKSAAVLHPDGSLRRLYCVESPESWFEDFGSGQLVAGRALVALDQDFTGVVKTDGYHVFPIPEGDCKGLYVANKTASSFEVRELQGGASTVSFSYRIVARRKDLAAPRLEKVQPIRTMAAHELPKPPADPDAQPGGTRDALPPGTATPTPTVTATAPSSPTTAPSATSTPAALPTRTPTPGSTGSPLAN